MEIQKVAWQQDSILKSNGQQRNDGFCGFENIQSAMCCSGILGTGGPNVQCGKPESGSFGLGGKMETGSIRSGGVVGTVGAGFNSRSQGFNGNFTCDEVQKPHRAHEFSQSLFSGWDHRNPLLESMTAKASLNNENSDGQFSPGSGLNSRQNLDELVSKILEEDPSKSTRQAYDDGHANGLNDRKFGLLPVANLDFGTSLNNIWLSDGKLSAIDQQSQLNNASYSNTDVFRSVLDKNWEASRAGSGFLQNQSTTASSVQSMDLADFSQRRHISSLLTLENHNQFSQACSQKPDAITSRSFGSFSVKPGSAEMELAMRCMEKPGPFTSSQYKCSDPPDPFEAWSKPSVSHSQDSANNPCFSTNSYPLRNHSLSCPPNTIAAHVSASSGPSELLLAEVKSTIQSLMGPNPHGNAAKQYLAQCLAQSGAAGGELLDSSPNGRRKQQSVFFNDSGCSGQNGYMPPFRTCFERNPLDHNILYGGNKTTAATLINGQNVTLRPAVKNLMWPPSKTVPSSLLPTAGVANAFATDKREFEMPPQTSCGSLFLEQNLPFAYVQPVGRKHSYLTPSTVPCQNIAMHLQSEMNQNSESGLNHVQDGPAVFHPESLYHHHQQAGVQFDIAGMQKVTQPTHISVRGIQTPWPSSQPHPTDNCECNGRCDVHNIGRVTPVILRPGEILNIHPSAVFGLPQVFPDVKLQRCFNSSSGLLLCLEECFEQLRNLEKEEKEVENELMNHSMGRCLTSANQTAIPRLPHNPSRVNRLVVESLREHSKVTALLGKMKKLRNQPLHANIYSAMETWMEGIRKVQARRKEEIVSSANRSNSGGSRAQEEKDILALTAAVEELLVQTRRARTCLWCALQISVYGNSIYADKGSTEPNNQEASVFYHSLNDWQLAECEPFYGSQKCM